MKIKIGFVLILFGIFISCKNREDNQNEKQSEKKDFFPVAEYFQNEINDVDSLPIGMKKYIIDNDKKDSVYIHADEFNQLAKNFQCKELNQGFFEKEFSETSFIDQTTQSATFTYSAKNPLLELQRVDVIANMSDGKNKISSVYLEKVMHINDALVLQKLLWRTGVSFQIITNKQQGNLKPDVEQIQVVWDPEKE